MITKIGKALAEKQDSSDQSDYIDKLKRLGVGYLGMGGTAIGGMLAHNAISSGDVTGRQTLWHGTTAENAEKIRKDGLLPTTEANASNTKALAYDPERYKKALGKSYLAPNLEEAAMYSLQADALSQGKTMQEALESAKDVRARARKMVKKDGVVKINAPTWKMKTVVNPEVDMSFDDWQKILDSQYDMTPKTTRRKIYDQMRNDVVFDGGVGTEYVKGSDKYKRLSLGELAEYVKANPGRFGKGVAKALGGTGLAAAGLYGLNKAWHWNDRSAE